MGRISIYLKKYARKGGFTLSQSVNLTPVLENVTGFPPVSDTLPFSLQLIGTTYANPDYHHRRPEDNFVTVIEYVISGSGFIDSPSGLLLASAGDSFLLHADEPHNYYANPKDPWVKIWINIDSRIANDILNAYGITTTMVYPGLDISNYLNQIHDIAKSNPGNPDLVFDRSFTIFIKLCQFLRDSLKPRQPFSDIPKNIVDLKNYIDLHLSEELNLEKCATITHLSVSQTIRAFCKAYGNTPYKYLNEQRFDVAKTLLRDSQLPLQEIAIQLGFADQYYFSSFFKKKCGKSPKEYRNYE